MSQLNSADIASLASTGLNYADEESISTSALNSADLESIDNSLVSQKLQEVTKSMLDKKDLVRKQELTKSSSIEGYKPSEIQLTGIDSGLEIQRDSDGNIISKTPIKLSSSILGKVPDEYQLKRYNGLNISSNNEDYVSSITGKDPSELTDKDYSNVAAWHNQELHKGYGSKDYSYSSYNPMQDYTNNGESSISLMLKKAGIDSEGNIIANGLNVDNGRDTAFESLDNAYIDSALRANTPEARQNRRLLNQYRNQRGITLDQYYQMYGGFGDGDSRLGEWFDQIQSAGYQTVARYLGTDIAGKLGFDQDYWKQIASEEGQAIADAWAGVSPETRRDFAKKLIEAREEWDKGNYISSILKYASQTDRVIADSMPQMAEMMIGNAIIGAVTGGAGAVANSGNFLATAARGFLSAGLLAGTEQTIMDNDKFTANYGRSMNASEMARSWFMNSLTLAPDEMLAGLGIKRFLPNSINKLFGQTAETAKNGPQRLGTVFKEVAGEAIQEPIQNSISEANATTQSTDDYFGKLAEQWQGENLAQRREESILGGLTAGSLSFTGSRINRLTNIADIISDHKFNKGVNASKETAATLGSDTVLSGKSSEIDENYSRDAISLSKDINRIEAANSVNALRAGLNAISKGKTDPTTGEFSKGYIDPNTGKLSSSLSVQAKTALTTSITSFVQKSLAKTSSSKEEQAKIFDTLAKEYSGLLGVDSTDKTEDDLKADVAVALAVRSKFMQDPEMMDLFAPDFKDADKTEVDKLTSDFLTTLKKLVPNANIDLINSAVNQAISEVKTNLRSGKSVNFEQVESDVVQSAIGYKSYNDELIKIANELKNPDLTTDRKVELESRQSAITGHVSRLFNNQYSKTLSFASALSKLASNPNLNSIKVNYPNGKGSFNLNKKSIISSSKSSGKIAQMLDYICDDAAKLATLLDRVDSNSNHKDHLATISEAKQSMKDGMTAILASLAKGVFVAPTSKFTGPKQSTTTSSNSNTSNTTSNRPNTEPVRSKKQQSQQQKQKTNNSTIAHPDYTMTSGGAVGSDSLWGEIAKEYGLGGISHFYEGKKPINDNANAPISKEDSDEGEIKAREADKTLERDYDKQSDYVKSLFKRNWAQVKYADSVIAIIANTLITEKGKKEVVNGGTGWAVQMAINEGKPVTVYDMSSKEWKKYNPSTGRFEVTSSPSLTKRTALIGTRGSKEKKGVNKRGKEYTKRLGFTDKELAEIRPVMEEVFRNTFGDQKYSSEKFYVGINGYNGIRFNVEGSVEAYPLQADMTGTYTINDSLNNSLSINHTIKFSVDGTEYYSIRHYYETNKSGTFDQRIYDSYKKYYDEHGNVDGKYESGRKTNSTSSDKVLYKGMIAAFKADTKALNTLVSTGTSPFKFGNTLSSVNGLGAVLTTVRNELRSSVVKTGKFLYNPKDNYSLEIKDGNYYLVSKSGARRELDITGNSIENAEDFIDYIRRYAKPISYALNSSLGVSEINEDIVNKLYKLLGDNKLASEFITRFAFKCLFPRLDDKIKSGANKYLEYYKILDKVLSDMHLTDKFNQEFFSTKLERFKKIYDGLKDKLDKLSNNPVINKKDLDAYTELIHEIVTTYNNKLVALDNAYKLLPDSQKSKEVQQLLDDAKKFVNQAVTEMGNTNNSFKNELTDINSTLSLPIFDKIEKGLSRAFAFEVEGKQTAIFTDSTKPEDFKTFLEKYDRRLHTIATYTTDDEIRAEAQRLTSKISTLIKNLNSYIKNNTEDKGIIGLDGNGVTTEEIVKSKAIFNNLILEDTTPETFEENIANNTVQSQSVEDLLKTQANITEVTEVTADGERPTVSKGTDKSQMDEDEKATDQESNDSGSSIGTDTNAINAGDDTSGDSGLEAQKSVSENKDGKSKDPAKASQDLLDNDILVTNGVNPTEAIPALNTQINSSKSRATSKLATMTYEELISGNDENSKFLKKWFIAVSTAAKRAKFSFTKTSTYSGSKKSKNRAKVNVFNCLFNDVIKDGKVIVPAYLSESPYFRILYKITPDKKGNPNINFNTNVLLATDLAVSEFLSTESLRDMFNPYGSSKDKCRVLGLNTDKITSQAAAAVGEIIAKHGITQNYLAARLGRIICNNLGLVPASNGQVGFYENVEMGLGMFALHYMNARGMITFDSINRDKLPESVQQHVENPDSTIPTVKYNSAAVFGLDVKSLYTKLSDLLDHTPSMREARPYFFKTRKFHVNKVRNMSPIHGVDKYQEKVLQNERNKAFTLYDDVFESLGIRDDMFDENQIYSQLEFIKKANGWVDLSDDSFVGTKNAYDSQKGKNKAIESEIQGLIQAILWRNQAKHYTKARKQVSERLAKDYIAKILFTKEIISRYGDAGSNPSKFIDRIYKDRFNNDDLRKKIYEYVDEHIGEHIYESPIINPDGTHNQFTFKKVHLGGDQLYFDHFMIRSGRIMINSRYVNPQTFKFQRFTLLPKELEEEYQLNPTDKTIEETQNINEAFALAQAFDSLGVSKQSSASLRDKVLSVGKAFNDYMNSDLTGDRPRESRIQNLIDEFTHDPEEFIKKYKDTFHIEGIENLGQCLNALTHLKLKAKALDDNQSSFKSRLSVEIDSTTSGFYLKFPQYPKGNLFGMEEDGSVSTTTDSLALATGLITDQTTFNDKVKEALHEYGIEENEISRSITIDELKKIPGFLDIYKLTAKKASESLIEYVDEQGNIRDDKLDEDFEKLTKEEKDFYKAIYKIMYPYLPRAEKKDGDFIISSALRTLMKTPTMVFGYAAGDGTTADRLVDEITTSSCNLYFEIMHDGGLETYLKKHKNDDNYSKKETEAKSVVAFMQKIEEQNKANGGETLDIYSELKDKLVTEIKIKTSKNKTTSLSDIFDNFIRPTYGKAVANAINENFHSFTEYNQIATNAGHVCFEIFNEAYLDELEKITKDKNGNSRVPSRKEMDEALDKVKELLPVFSYFNESADSNKIAGVPLYEYQKGVNEALSDVARSVYRYLKTEIGKDSRYKKLLSTKILRSELKTIVNGRLRPAVLPIHYLDSLTMLFQQLRDPTAMVSIYDAIICAASKATEKATNYNGDSLTIARDIFILKQYRDVLAKNISLRLKTLTGYTDKTLANHINPFIGVSGKAHKGSMPFGEFNDTNKKGEPIPIKFEDIEKAFTDTTGNYGLLNQIAQSTGSNKKKKDITVGYADFMRIMDSMGYNTFRTIDGHKVNLAAVIAGLFKVKKYDRKTKEEIEIAPEDAEYKLNNGLFLTHLSLIVDDVAKDRQTINLNTAISINLASPLPSPGMASKESLADSLVKAETEGEEKTKTSSKSESKKETTTEEYFEPDLFDSNGENIETNDNDEVVIQGELKDKESVLNVLKKIYGIDESIGMSNSKEELDNLMHVLETLNYNELRTLLANVTLTNDGNKRSGYRTDLHRINSYIRKYTSSPIRKALMSYFGMTGAVSFTHEAIHSATSFILGHITPEATGIISKIKTIQKYVAEHLTYKDFLPENFDRLSKEDKEFTEQKAKYLYGYILNNNNYTQKLGAEAGLSKDYALGEFMSVCLSAPSAIKALKNQKIKTNNVFDILSKLFKNLWDIVWNNKSIKEAVSELSNTFTGSERVNRSDNLYDELLALSSSLSKINQEESDKTVDPSYKCKTSMTDIFTRSIELGNKVLSPFTSKIPDILKDKSAFSKTGKNGIGTLLKMGALLPFSKRARREALITAARVLHLSEQGFIMTTIRELYTPDEYQRALYARAAFLRNCEKTYEESIDIYAQEILDAMGTDKVTESQGYAINHAIRADWQCLFGKDITDTEIESFKKTISSDEELDKKIKELETKINKIQCNNKIKKLIKNESRALAYFIITGKGNGALYRDANSIAKAISNLLDSGRGEDEIYIDDLTHTIDQYTTYLATRHYVPSFVRQEFSHLGNKGIKAIINNHKIYESNFRANAMKFKSFEGTTYSSQADFEHIKGRIEPRYNEMVDVRIESTRNEEALIRDGYVRDSELKTFGNTSTAVYRRKFVVSKRRDGATIAFKGQHSIGTSSFNVEFYGDQKTSLTPQEFRTKVENAFFDDLDTMMSKDLSMSEIENISKNIIPVNPQRLSGSMLRYMNNDEDTITQYTHNEFSPEDYKIVIPYDYKESINMDTNGVTMLARMRSRQELDMQADNYNLSLFALLQNDADINMNPETLIHKDDPSIEYIKIDPNSDEFKENKALMDAWKQMPDELKKLFLNYKGEPLYIRKTWIHLLVGTTNKSLIDLKIMKNVSADTKKIVVMAEDIFRYVAQQAKRSILFRIPSVLIDNCLGNTAYLIAQGVPMYKAIALQYKYYQLTQQYIEHKKKFMQLSNRKKLGIAAMSELNAREESYLAMHNNPIVHRLMQKGFYSAITNDIRTADMESTSKIANIIKDKFGKIAENKFVRNLYMSEGTFFYDTLYKATEYSDFVARCVLYEHRMDKVNKEIPKTIIDSKGNNIDNPKYTEAENKVFDELWDVFVNYDLPQSSFEQYMNDMGLFFFTKYFKRTQRALIHNLTDNPAGVLTMFAIQGITTPMHSIFDQNILNKNYGALVRNPFSNFITAGIPIPIQWLLGI